MTLTTSYFTVSKHVKGKKISIARFHLPIIRRGIDEILSSFAPSTELLREYKDGQIDWTQYKRRYTDEQRQHYREAPEDFENLLRRSQKEDLVLLCYERFEGPHTKCHRMLLINMLKSVAETTGIKVTFCDEVPYNHK